MEMNEQKIRALYEAYPALKALEKNKLALIEKNIYFRSLSAGEKMSSAKGVCEGFIFVLQGKIKIHRLSEAGNETHLYYLQKGELCHEALSCLKAYESLSIVGEAIQECQLALLPMQFVREQLLGDSTFLSYMYEDLYEKLSMIIQGKETSKHDSLEERLMNHLVSKGSRMIYMTHRDLAMDVNASREAVSRKLKELEQRGYLELQRGKIILLK